MPRFINPVPQYSNSSGVPITDGKMYFYEVGSVTPKDVYLDAGLKIVADNPVLLEADGSMPDRFLSGTYRTVLIEPSTGQRWERDNVGSDTSLGYGDEWDSTVTYNAPNVVLFDGIYYTSLTNNNTGNTPDSSPSKWEELAQFTATDKATLGTISTAIGTMSTVLATGTDTYTADLTLADGRIYAVKFENANTGAATLNGLDIVNRAGLPMLAGDLNTVTAYDLRYDLSNDRFVAPSVKVHCYISRNTSQSIPNGAFTEVNLNNTEYDSAGAFNDGVTANTITIPAGFTRARFRLSCEFATGTNGVRQLRLHTNGLAQANNTMSVQSSSNNRSTRLQVMSEWEYVSPSDLFTIRVLQNSGGNLDLNRATIYTEFE